jgi:N-acyl-D-aspartate/D-glutamate deacylase
VTSDLQEQRDGGRCGEAIGISERSGARLQLSHNESHYPNWGKEAEIMRILEEARERGLEVATDVPPYTSPAASLMGDGHADKIWIASSSENPDVVGKNLAQIGETRGLHPLDAAFELILEQGGGLGLVIEHHFEPDLRYLVSHPLAMIESDGSAFAPYGELGEGQPHPRSYGVFPLTFRKYVRGETRAEEPREEGEMILTLHEAVRKMTSFPAQMLRLRDRALQREGMWVDIVIFDPERIEGKATHNDPHQYFEGMPYVMVNGQVVIERGEHTGVLAGEILRNRDRYGAAGGS